MKDELLVVEKFGGCSRCGTAAGQRTAFYGGYTADLCTDCVLRWQRFILASSEWERYLDADLLLRIAIASADTDAALAHQSKIRELQKVFWRLAEEWVERGQAVEQPSTLE